MAESLAAQFISMKVNGVFFTPIEYIPNHEAFNFESEHPEAVVETLRREQVTGVVCANDVTAARLLRIMVDGGVRIPEEMQVCGFDDVKYASLLAVPLTSYQQPCLDIGKIAVNTMSARMQHPEGPIHRTTLKGRLVMRDSAPARRS